jgi:prevent-host-death family protein
MPAADTTYTEIGAFDAKTRLSELLRKVDQGERFTITLRGRPVADIVPSKMKDRERAAEAVRRLLAMPKIEGISGDTLLEWIREGRK